MSFYLRSDYDFVYFLSVSVLSLSAVEYLPPTRTGETCPGEDAENFTARLCGSLHRGASHGLQGFCLAHVYL